MQAKTLHSIAPEKSLLTEKQAREIIPMSLAWFRRARLEGRGPRYLKISNRVFYPRFEIETYVESLQNWKLPENKP
jgi:hypothetical protein